MDPARSRRHDRPHSRTSLPPVRPAGDPASTAEAWALVAPFRSRLIALARSRGLSLPDAQDVAHHVMCRAVERGVADPDRVEAGLVRAVVTRCQEVRADEVRQEQLLARTCGDERLAGGVDDAVCDRAQVRWLLGKLPVRERNVVMLSVSGETVTGIAKATGLSYPTVDRLLSRARKEMRRLAGQAGLVAVAVWRHRRLAGPAGATAAVAVASVTVLAPHAAPLPAEAAVVPRRAPVVATVRDVPRAPAVESRVTTANVRRVAPAPAVDAAPPAAPRVLPVAKPEAAVTSRRADRVSQVEECLRSISIEVGSGGTVACGDGTT